MAFTEADLAAINAAIVKGEKSVAFADRSVTYRDMDELLRARAEIIADLAGETDRPRQYGLYSRKGLEA